MHPRWQTELKRQASATNGNGQERGTERKAPVEDLYVLGEHIRCMKEEHFYKERVRREDRK